MSKFNKKRTKDIINESISKIKNTPLYNTQTLDKIRQRSENWLKTKVKDKDEWLKTHNTLSGSNIPKELIYTPLSCPDLDYQKDIGNSGEEPFTRGIHPNMYRGREFTMRQLTGFGSPEDTNTRIKFMLDHGASGLNILFDIPTIQMYDSDDPMAKGQVGLSGVCVDSVDDMELLFKDIPLDKVTISIVTHYPSNTAILFSMFLAMADERGIPWNNLRGSVQNDIIMEEVIRSGAAFIPPKDCFRIQCDNIEFFKKNIPYWNFVTLNGYNLKEFGTSGITEMAVALANGIATIEEMIERGYDVDWIADRIAFFWSIGNDFFEEIARLRAVRRLWYKILRYRFKAKNERSMKMRCHTQTSGGSLIQQEPLNNIVRAAYHALAAVLGGTQSLHVDSYDEAYSIPTEDAALLALRTQQIIQEETGITDVVDPLGGSFYIEALTNDIEKRILEEIDSIEKDGGIISTIESGKLNKTISSYFCKQQEQIDNEEIKLVALNRYKSDLKPPPIDVFHSPEGVEKRQQDKLHILRTNRNNDNVTSSLEALKNACIKKKNIIPFCVSCAHARCTEGEIFSVFKESFGLWQTPSLW